MFYEVALIELTALQGSTGKYFSCYAIKEYFWEYVWKHIACPIERALWIRVVLACPRDFLEFRFLRKPRHLAVLWCKINTQLFQRIAERFPSLVFTAQNLSSGLSVAQYNCGFTWIWVDQLLLKAFFWWLKQFINTLLFFFTNFTFVKMKEYFFLVVVQAIWHRILPNSIFVYNIPGRASREHSQQGCSFITCCCRCSRRLPLCLLLRQQRSVAWAQWRSGME